jgi:myosin heavy subunit
LTFYGKFGDQDIGYIDKECLKYVRQRGVKIDASQLLDLGLGEWLVIMGKNTRTLKVTAPRVTHHGAETPRLEYVAPRPTEVKKTIDELSKSIAAAMEKEQVEGSELEKSKRKIRDLETKLHEVQQKANIKLSVKEMIESQSAPASVNASVDKTEFEKLQKQIQKLEPIAERANMLDKEVTRLQKELSELQPLKRFRDALFDVLPTQQPTALPTGSQSIGLQPVKTIVDLEEVKKHAPKVGTDTVKGKIMALARDGFFNNWQSVGDISKALIEKYSFNATEQAINGALKDLVEEHILGMKHTDRNRWKLAPDVVFEGKKEAKA